MRVLVISDLYPPVSFGGYEMECATVVDHLRGSHEVLVLTSDREAAGVAPEGGIARRLPYSGGGLRVAAAAPLHAVRAARTMRGVLGAFRPDAVMVWNATAIPTAAVRVAVDSGPPVILRLCERWFAERILLADHFSRYLVPGERGLRGAWGRAVRGANRHPALRLTMTAPFRAAVSWNSDALRGSVHLPAAVHPVLERTIHPATRNGDYFSTLARNPSGRPSVVFVGRVGWQKGAEVAVRAIALLRHRHGIDSTLVMVGPYEPDMRRRMETLAAELGIAGRVELRGKLDRVGLGRELSRAHAMVAPSQAEAFGLACVEAAAARVPVVASRVDGIPEALREDEHALLFAPGDAADCAAALARTLTDTGQTEARVGRAFERAQELSVARYLAATDRFLADTMTAFARGGAA